MRKLPPRYAPVVFATAQAAVTTAIASAVATAQAVPVGWTFMGRWLSAWLLSWSLLLPVVIGMAPVLRRAIESLTDAANADDRGI